MKILANEKRLVDLCAIALAAGALASCASSTTPEAAAPDPGLAGSAWRLAELRSSDDAIGVVSPADPSRYTLSFGADGRASAQLDCNRAAGGWSATPAGAAGGEIAFTQMAMTRALCVGESLDTRIAREFDFVRTYMIQGDDLILILMADGGQQVWTRQ